ncbi:MAG TPA: hypothetical protein VMO81_02840 [Aestuariivirgaceae bacterium]|nr:hypothetical protein [Aestuariivirgaceae bacterium]
MAPDRAVSTEHVRDVILRDLPPQAGRDWDWEVSVVTTARESWLFKAASPQAPWPLAVKVYCTASPDALPARQLRVLRQYHDAMAGRPDLTVPTPWAALPKHRALMMEWIDAPRVDKLLNRAFGRTERSRIMAAAGRWLRHFHDQGKRDARRLGDLDLLRPLDTLMGKSGVATVADPAFRATHATLQDCLRDLSDVPIALVTAHGDFAPANLFLGDDRAVGFDFKAHKARPVARDIMHFLVYAKSFNTSTWRLLTTQVVRHDQEAFLAGYGALDDAMDARLLTVFQLSEALRSWAYSLDRIRREGSDLRRTTRIRRLRDVATHTARILRRG